VLLLVFSLYYLSFSDDQGLLGAMLLVSRPMVLLQQQPLLL
jgi:hypothetical protein